MRAYVNIKRASNLAKSGQYKIDKNHHFEVCLIGLIGKLPVAEDILKTHGDKYDLMSSFQTYFLYGGEIYHISTFSRPLDHENVKTLKKPNLILVLANDNLSSSRKDCLKLKELIGKESELANKTLMLVNKSVTANQESFPG